MKWMFGKKRAVCLDCRGLACPQPVLRTRDALDKGNRVVEVQVDNEAAKENISRFAADRNCTVTASGPDNGCWTVRVRAGRLCRRKLWAVESYNCAASAPAGPVYVISSAAMGRGDDELGWALLQTYIQTIEKVQPLPSKILFYNGGVRLVAEESGALKALQTLQGQGVEILVCGTCLDYFQLKEQLRIGRISNMYEIMSTISTAARVFNPF